MFGEHTGIRCILHPALEFKTQDLHYVRVGFSPFGRLPMEAKLNSCMLPVKFFSRRMARRCMHLSRRVAYDTSLCMLKIASCFDSMLDAHQLEYGHPLSTGSTMYMLSAVSMQGVYTRI